MNLEERLSVFQVTGDVGDQPLALFFGQDILPEGGHLREVVIIGRVVAGHVARHLKRGVERCRSVGRSCEAVGEVIGVSGVIRFESHRSVALIVERTRTVRTVDR